MIRRRSLLLALVVVVVVAHKQGSVEGADLQVTGLNFSNHSMNATADLSPTGTAVTDSKDQKNMDNSFRSEVYKMHANGLMLLHAQRTRSGIEAKKSQLNNKLVNSGINYHIRKKSNDTLNAVQENERHMEAKLGDLPQVRQRRRDVSQVRERRAFNAQNISQVVKNISCTHSATNNVTNNVSCRHDRRHVGGQKHRHHGHHHRHHHHHHQKHKHQWRSIVQGEDAFGEEVKKTRVYPEKFKKPVTEENRHDDVKVSDVIVNDVKVNDVKVNDVEINGVTKRGVLIDKRQIENIHPSDASSKRARLKRALDLMGGEFGVDDNPIYDNQQSQTVTVDQNLQKEVPDIPEIGGLQDNGDKDSRVKFFYDQQERSSDVLAPDIPNIPKIDDTFAISKILPIDMLKKMADDDDDDDNNTESDGTEVGDRRASVSRDKFVDDDAEESIESVRGVTPPTPIPEITAPSTISNIPDIKDITDIPTLRSIPAPQKTTESSASKLSRVLSIAGQNSTTVQF